MPFLYTYSDTDMLYIKLWKREISLPDAASMKNPLLGGYSLGRRRKREEDGLTALYVNRP